MRATRAAFVALIVMTFVLIALTVALTIIAFSRHSTGHALIGLLDATVAFACGLCALWIAKGGKA